MWGFVADKVALGQVSVAVLRFFPITIIPPLLHTHSFMYHRRCIILMLGADVNPLNAELNPICRLLTSLGAHHILHVSRIRVK